jgi:hypothetical protein
MDIGVLLRKVHPEVMEMCEYCQGNGQYMTEYFDGYDARPDVAPCERCNTLGYILKKDVAIKSNLNIIKSVTNLFKGVQK